MAVSHQPNEFRAVVKKLENDFMKHHQGLETFHNEKNDSSNLNLPPWICQPYIRMEPDEHKRVIAEKDRIAKDPQTDRQKFYDDEGNQISRKLAKKLKRLQRKPSYEVGVLKRERSFELCSHEACVNPVVSVIEIIFIGFCWQSYYAFFFFCL